MNFDDFFDSPKPPKDMTHSYTDGNNNSYYITPSQLVYSPVSPLQSSSGIYSGGDPSSVEIENTNYKKISQIFNSILENKDIQIPTRPKGCGTLSFVQNNHTIYIQSSCSEQQQLEDLLKSILA